MNSEIPNKTTNDPLAIISLILALLVFFLGPLIPLAAIPAIICARISIKRIQQGDALKGDAYAIAAMVIGYVAIFCYLIAILIGMRIFGHVSSLSNLGITLPH